MFTEKTFLSLYHSLQTTRQPSSFSILFMATFKYFSCQNYVLQPSLILSASDNVMSCSSQLFTYAHCVVTWTDIS